MCTRRLKWARTTHRYGRSTINQMVCPPETGFKMNEKETVCLNTRVSVKPVISGVTDGSVNHQSRDPRLSRAFTHVIIFDLLEMRHCKNEWVFRPPLCTYKLIWSRRTVWGWWDEWDGTPSRHSIRNSNPGGLKPSPLYFSVTEALHNIESLRVSREETFYFFEPWIAERGSNRRSPAFQAGSFSIANDSSHTKKLMHTCFINLFFCHDYKALSE